MPLKIMLASLAFLVLVPLASADDGNVQYAKTFVEALEQWDSKTGLPIQPQIKNVKIVKINEPVKGPKAGQVTNIQVTYPQGTGSDEVDAFLKVYAEKSLDNFRQATADLSSDSDDQPSWVSQTFVISQPYDRYLSVIFYVAQGHEDKDTKWQYEVLSFDLAENRPLTVEDIFRASDEGLKAPHFLANYINAALDRHCLEQGYECMPCGIKPEDFHRSNLRNFALTPYGVALLLGPTELGPKYAEETRYFDIDKQDIVDWGVRDNFWIAR